MINRYKYETPDEIYPEKAVHKVYQLYTEHMNEPSATDAAISTALKRFEEKEKASLDIAGIHIAALERVAADNGGILPEGSMRDQYKKMVVENVLHTMCSESYDPDDPESIVAYEQKPRELLIAHEPFRMMFSDELNDIADDILGDERLVP
jgi:predicted component of viral defense system (DUF524 family)